MNLQQLHNLKRWHLRHLQQPVEKWMWDAVLTVWMTAWVGLPAAVLIDAPWAKMTGLFLLLFFPGCYVGLRGHLHRVGRLRCDWLAAPG